jgi:hypothetical protein
MVKLRYLLPLALVTGLLAVPASASADSAGATISIAGNATLISTSPGPVAITVHYSCLPAFTGIVGVSISEGLGSGFGSVNATFDGQNHSATVTVTGPFVPGTAEARAFVNNGFSTTIADDTISIK